MLLFTFLGRAGDFERDTSMLGKRCIQRIVDINSKGYDDLFSFKDEKKIKDLSKSLIRKSKEISLLLDPKKKYKWVFEGMSYVKVKNEYVAKMYYSAQLKNHHYLASFHFIDDDLSWFR